MSRPPSARPKTSAGSRATSARVRRPTTSLQNNIIEERPQSRTAMTADNVPTERIGSRAGIGPPSISMGERVQSRLGTTQVGRPPTGLKMSMPPGTTMRPITQQGLTGVRAPSRLGTTANRQVLDKSYFISLLRNKMNSLNAEIDKLKQELEQGERDRQNLFIYEKRAEEEAGIIRDLQGKLIDYNMIMDRLNTNSDLNELEEELSELRIRNEEAERAVNELFAERQTKEDELREVERQVEAQKAANVAARNNMDSHLREEFEQLKEEAEQMAEEYRLKKQELDELTAKKEQFDEELANSPLKQQAMVLHEQLAELEEKRASIVEEMNAEGSPEEQRQKLLQTVVRTTDEVTAIQKQIEAVNEQIDQGNEELREFENECENIAGEKNEKYRELKIKEKQIDEFLDSYEQHREEQEAMLADLSGKIVEQLQLISPNCSKTDIFPNVTGMDVTGIETLNDQSASASELQDLHVRLQEELIMLKESEQKLEEESELLNKKISEMSEKLHEFDDIDTLKAEIEQKRQELEQRQAELEEILPELEGNCQNVIEKLSRANVQLEDNDEYTKLKNIEKKWKYIEQSNAALREAMAARDAETNYTTLKQEAMRLQAEYNALLIATMKTR